MNEMTIVFLSFIPAFIYNLLIFSYYWAYRKRRNKLSDLLSHEEIQELYKSHNYRNYKIDDSKRKKSSKNKSAFINIIGYSGLSVFFSAIITTIIVWLISILSFVKFEFVENASYLTSLVQISSTFVDRLDPFVCFAAFGAYLWGIFEFLNRYQRRDWTPIVQHQIWLRIPITMLVAFFIIPDILKTDTSASLIAFGIGAFPVETIRKFITDKVSSNTKIAGTSVPLDNPPWNLVQGVSQQTIERLREIDIEDPSHLANADPMNIHIRTNIEWRQILDLIDQCILISYIGNKSVLLRPYGIRGSIEFSTFYRHSIVDNPHKQVLGKISELLDAHDGALVWNLVTNLSHDTQVKLIKALLDRVKTPANEQNVNAESI